MRLVHQGADMIVPIPHHANEAKVATEDGTNGRQHEAEAMADLYLVPPAGEDRVQRCGVVTAEMAQDRGPESERVRDVAEIPQRRPCRQRRMVRREATEHCSFDVESEDALNDVSKRDRKRTRLHTRNK